MNSYDKLKYNMYQQTFENLYSLLDAVNPKIYYPYLNDSEYLNECCTSLHMVPRQTGKTTFLISKLKSDDDTILITPNYYLAQEIWIKVFGAKSHGRVFSSRSILDNKLRGISFSKRYKKVLMDEYNLYDENIRGRDINADVLPLEKHFKIFGLST